MGGRGSTRRHRLRTRPRVTIAARRPGTRGAGLVGVEPGRSGRPRGDREPRPRLAGRRPASRRWCCSRWRSAARSADATAGTDRAAGRRRGRLHDRRRWPPTATRASRWPRTRCWRSLAARARRGRLAAPSAELGAEDADEAHHLARVAAEVVRERELPVGGRRSGVLGRPRRAAAASTRTSCAGPDAPTGWPKLFSPPSVLTGRSPCRSKVPASTSFHAVPRSEKPRSSISTSSVGVKQSCTSAMASSWRGSVDAGLVVGVLARSARSRGRSCSRTRDRAGRCRCRRRTTTP